MSGGSYQQDDGKYDFTKLLMVAHPPKVRQRDGGTAHARLHNLQCPERIAD
jgi:hypothetical protein